MIRKIKGFTLLEVLIALFILSFGLLGLARLQIVALQYNHQAYEFTLADNQLQYFIELLRAHKGQTDKTNLFNEWDEINRTLMPNVKSDYSLEDSNLTVQLQFNNNQNICLNTQL